MAQTWQTEMSSLPELISHVLIYAWLPKTISALPTTDIFHFLELEGPHLLSFSVSNLLRRAAHVYNVCRSKQELEPHSIILSMWEEAFYDRLTTNHSKLGLETHECVFMREWERGQKNWKVSIDKKTLWDCTIDMALSSRCRISLNTLLKKFKKCQPSCVPQNGQGAAWNYMVVPTICFTEENSNIGEIQPYFIEVWEYFQSTAIKFKLNEEFDEKTADVSKTCYELGRGGKTNFTNTSWWIWIV